MHCMRKMEEKTVVECRSMRSKVFVPRVEVCTRNHEPWNMQGWFPSRSLLDEAFASLQGFLKQRATFVSTCMFLHSP